MTQQIFEFRRVLLVAALPLHRSSAVQGWARDAWRTKSPYTRPTRIMGSQHENPSFPTQARRRGSETL